MTHLNRVATLATQQDKRTKKNVFAVVESLCQDDSPTLNMEQQAILYKFFMCSIKPAATAFNWVALAIRKQEYRAYLKYVYCDHEHPDGPQIVATDGHRVHMCPAPEGMGKGFHDLNGVKVNLDKMTYPDYQRIIPSGGRSILWERDHAKVVAVPRQGKPCLRYEFHTADGKIYCDKGYFDLARQKQDSVTVHYTDHLSALRLELDEERTAVVMPVRMYGGVE